MTDANATSAGATPADIRDAQRYRYLRSRDLDTIEKGGVFAGLTPKNVVLAGLDLDAAVDAAMGEPAPEVDPDVRALRSALRRIVDANEAFNALLPPGWQGDAVDDACRAARPLLGYEYPEPPFAPGDDVSADLAVKLAGRDEELRVLRIVLRSMMRFLHNLCCPGCKAQGRELNARCCKDADCDAGWFGVDAEKITALLNIGEVLMPGTLAGIEAASPPPGNAAHDPAAADFTERKCARFQEATDA